MALAALAAPIARENPDKIGWEAMRIALAGYVIPFIFVYSPALMLQAGDPMAAQLGFYGAVALATFKALVAIGLFGIVAIGFLFTRLSWIELIVAFIAALCLLGEFRFAILRVHPRRSRRAGNGGSVRATRWRRLEPLPRLRRRREDAVSCGLYARVDPFDREDRVAGEVGASRQAGLNWYRRG